MSSLPDPKDSLPALDLPIISKSTGRLMWVHGHRCPHCKSLWPCETRGCTETMNAECPACFSRFEDLAARMREHEGEIE